MGPASVRSGFRAAEPPPLALPASHRAWDEAAAALPLLWRDLTARRVLGDELPLLAADAEALPDAMLWRACTVLGARCMPELDIQKVRDCVLGAPD